MRHQDLMIGGALLAVALVFGVAWTPQKAHSRDDLVKPTEPTVQGVATVFTEEEDRNGRKLSWKGRVLVIYGGSCASCELKKVVPDNLVKGKYAQRLVVFTHEELPETWTAPHCPPDVRVLTKTPNSIKTLAAQWTGRWYLFVDGRLTDYAKDAFERPHDM